MSTPAPRELPPALLLTSTFRAPGVGPPTVLPDEPDSISTSSAAIFVAAVPVEFVPMKFPAIKLTPAACKTMPLPPVPPSWLPKLAMTNPSIVLDPAATTSPLAPMPALVPSISTLRTALSPSPGPFVLGDAPG